jgi:hypothetical protein
LRGTSCASANSFPLRRGLRGVYAGTPRCLRDLTHRVAVLTVRARDRRALEAWGGASRAAAGRAARREVRLAASAHGGSPRSISREGAHSAHTTSQIRGETSMHVAPVAPGDRAARNVWAAVLHPERSAPGHPDHLHREAVDAARPTDDGVIRRGLRRGSKRERCAVKRVELVRITRAAAGSAAHICAGRTLRDRTRRHHGRDESYAREKPQRTRPTPRSCRSRHESTISRMFHMHRVVPESGERPIHGPAHRQREPVDRPSAKQSACS